MSETSKAAPRRRAEKWFERYAPEDARGIDIGCQNDPIHPNYRKWDLIFGDGDATRMDGVAGNSYDVVYASHVLEHLDDPHLAIQNWMRICKPGGNVIICVPHRDLYEKKTELPSRWNLEHKTFWLPYSPDGNPGTYGLLDTIVRALGQANVISLHVLADGYLRNGDDHASGEYSIEAIIRK